MNNSEIDLNLSDITDRCAQDISYLMIATHQRVYCPVRQDGCPVHSGFHVSYHNFWRRTLCD